MDPKPRQDGDTPLASKKFVAYLIAELTWKAIVVLLIVSKDKIGDNIILLTIVTIAGFLEVAYILGQVYIDRYLKIADMAFDKAREVAADGKDMLENKLAKVDPKAVVDGTVIPVVAAGTPPVGAPVADPKKD